MNRIDLLSLQISNMKFNVLSQQMITREIQNELKRLEKYLTKEEK